MLMLCVNLCRSDKNQSSYFGLIGDKISLYDKEQSVPFRYFNNGSSQIVEAPNLPNDFYLRKCTALPLLKNLQ